MDDEYVTSDLGEAAALITSGCVMRDMQWRQEKAYFLFNDSATCQPLGHKYFFEGLSLNCRVFYENLRNIKRKIHTGQNTLGGEQKHVSYKRPYIR